MKKLINYRIHETYVPQKSEDGWIRLSVPKKLADRVKEMIESGVVDYNSLSSFVQDAVRRRLEELEKIRIVGEEYHLDEEEIKHMAELEHTNVAVNGGRTVVAVKDNRDGRIYDVYVSRTSRGAKLFCTGDDSFDCVHVKYVYHIILPRLEEYIEMYRQKRKKVR